VAIPLSGGKAGTIFHYLKKSDYYILSSIKKYYQQQTQAGWRRGTFSKEHHPNPGNDPLDREARRYSATTRFDIHV
jgi:hypothetical protein